MAPQQSARPLEGNDMIGSSAVGLVIVANMLAVVLHNYSIPVQVNSPDVSHAGTEVAFMSASGAGGPSNTNLFVYTLASGQLRQITNGFYNVDHPTWAAEDSAVIFNGYGPITGNQEIWYVSPDGSSPPAAIVNAYEHEQQPSVSPDGTRVAYMVSPPDHQLWIVDLVSGASNQVVTDQTNTFFPHWRSNTEIVFASNTAAWSVPDTGGNTTLIMSASDSGQSGPVLEAVPSPDGGRFILTIARNSNQSEPVDLWLLNYDGSLSLLIASESVGGGDVRAPCWTRDGEGLFFSGTGQLWKATDLPGVPVPVKEATWGTLKDLLNKTGE